MSKLDHAASLTSSDAASTRKATLQQRITNRKSINTGYNVLFLRRKVARFPGGTSSVPRTLYLGAVNGNLLCCPKRGKASRRDFHQSLRLSPFLWLRWLALILFDFAPHLTRGARASLKMRQTGST